MTSVVCMALLSFPSSVVGHMGQVRRRCVIDATRCRGKFCYRETPWKVRHPSGNSVHSTTNVGIYVEKASPNCSERRLCVNQLPVPSFPRWNDGRSPAPKRPRAADARRCSKAPARSASAATVLRRSPKAGPTPARQFSSRTVAGITSRFALGAGRRCRPDAGTESCDR